MTESVIALATDMFDATGLVAEPEALRARFRQDGYLLLRGVIDRATVVRAREQMVEILRRAGLVNEEGLLNSGFEYDEVRDIGGRSTQLGVNTPGWIEEQYREVGIHESLIQDPGLRSVLEAVAGGPIRYLPIMEYRSRPPDSDSSVRWHQDGWFNNDLEMITAWIPLGPIDRKLGGLAVASGMHTGGYLHAGCQPPDYRVADDVVPLGAQRRAECRDGDVILFDRTTPHTGVPNLTADELRFSFDIRFQSAAATSTAVVGEILDIDVDHIVVVVDGSPVALSIDDGTFIRERGGNRLERSAVNASELVPGTRVLVTHAGSRALLVRMVAF